MHCMQWFDADDAIDSYKASRGLPKGGAQVRGGSVCVFSPGTSISRGSLSAALRLRLRVTGGDFQACRTTRLDLGSLHSPCQSASGSKETFMVQSLTILLSGPCLPHEKKMTNRMKVAPGGAHRTAVQARRTPQWQSLHKRRES